MSVHVITKKMPIHKKTEAREMIILEYSRMNDEDIGKDGCGLPRPSYSLSPAGN